MSLVNGRWCKSLSARDRGIHYGDGVFETMAVQHGEPLCLDRHLARLERGCRRLAIPVPGRLGLLQEIGEMCSGVEQGVLKVIVTRGEGGRGYTPAQGSPTRVLIPYPWPVYPAHYWQDGIVACVCHVRLGRNPWLAGIKHLNRLEQVLARRECDDARVPEGLMLDAEGWVIEGTTSNLFIVKGGQLRTPQLSHCGVEGTIRGLVIDLVRAQDWLPVSVAGILLPEVLRADEVFLCNSIFGIWPVVGIGEQHFDIGSITRHLQQELVRSRAIVAVG
jgi:4-amino-4-deoxychorismate lyase